MIKMNKNNNKILIWIIVILAALNVSIIGTIFFRYNNADGYSPKTSTNQEMVIPKNHLGQFFRDELGLSYEQHNKFREIRHHYHQEANKVKDSLFIIRNSIINELGKPVSNKEFLQKSANKTGFLHKKLKLLTIDYYLGMKDICNKEQKEKLYKIFKAMLNDNGNPEMPKNKIKQ